MSQSLVLCRFREALTGLRKQKAKTLVISLDLDKTPRSSRESNACQRSTQLCWGMLVTGPKSYTTSRCEDQPWHPNISKGNAFGPNEAHVLCREAHSYGKPASSIGQFHKIRCISSFSIALLNCWRVHPDTGCPCSKLARGQRSDAHLRGFENYPTKKFKTLTSKT